MKHKLYDCPGTKDACLEGRCLYCEGGLTYCTVCRGAEGDLPTECPGRKMTDKELESVRSGMLDFICGEWRSLDAH